MIRGVKKKVISTVILIWIGITSIVVAYNDKTTLSGLRNSNASLVVSNVEGGLGDINWATNIGKELEKITGIQPTYLFVGSIKKETLEHLKKRSDLGGEPKIIQNLIEVEPGQIGAYVCDTDKMHQGENLDLKAIETVMERFGCTVLFHLRWKDQAAMTERPSGVWTKCIPLEEYGVSAERIVKEHSRPHSKKARKEARKEDRRSACQETRIFFQDYKEKYGLAVSEADCVRLKLSADEFYNRLGEEAKKQFNLEYVKELEKKIGVGVPYNFVYYNLFAKKKDKDSQQQEHKATKNILLHLIEQQSLTKKKDFNDLLNTSQIALTLIAKLQGQNNKDSDKPITFLVNQLDLDREAKLEEDPQKALAQAHITFGSDGVQQLYLAEINKTVRLVSYVNLSPEAFEYFLLKSELVAGCTGDMSLTQVLSSKRIPVYEVLRHKSDFYTDGLNVPWIEALQEIGISVEKDLEAFPGLEEDATKVSFSGMKVLTPENVRQAYPIFHSKLLQNAFSPWFKKRVEEIMKTKEPKQHLPAEHSDKSLSDSYSSPKPMITSSA